MLTDGLHGVRNEGLTLCNSLQTHSVVIDQGLPVSLAESGDGVELRCFCVHLTQCVCQQTERVELTALTWFGFGSCDSADGLL